MRPLAPVRSSSFMCTAAPTTAGFAAEEATIEASFSTLATAADLRAVLLRRVGGKRGSEQGEEASNWQD